MWSVEGKYFEFVECVLSYSLVDSASSIRWSWVPD